LKRALVWFRRGLRAHDHAAPYHALRAAGQVWCVFKKLEPFFVEAYPMARQAASLAAPPASVAFAIRSLEVLGFTRARRYADRDGEFTERGGVALGTGAARLLSPAPAPPRARRRRELQTRS
jgi:hypothetical protein